jgi:branched-subunit amino acid permease
MKTDQLTTKECVYLIYAYISIATFVLMAISKITDNLGKALYFNPIVTSLIVLNMIVFISSYYYNKRHHSHQNHNHL